MGEFTKVKSNFKTSQYFEERNLIRTIEQKCLLKVKPFPVVNTMIIKADIQSNDAIFKIVRRY